MLKHTLLFSMIMSRGSLVSSFTPLVRRALSRNGLVRLESTQSAPAQDFDLREFRRLGLTDPLLDSIRSFGYVEPSPIQRATIPEVLSGNSLAFAATTGSGKTLAYLLPAVQALKAAEDLAPAGEDRPMKRPKVLVLVPTRELAEQVLTVAKGISHFAKFSSTMVVGGDDYGKQTRALSGSVDLVVASPGRLLKHREMGNFHLSKVSHVIIDEVDTMLVQGFGPDIKQLLGPILFSPQRAEAVQFILATATMTKAVRKLLDEGSLPPCRLLETSDLGQAVSTCSHKFVNTAGQDKLTMLLDVVQGHSTAAAKVKGNEGGVRTMVFCNTVASCRAAEHSLTDAGIECVGYHGEMNSAARSSALESFKLGDVPLLVCSDLAARGLDLPDVAQVVMFDFPMNSVDYLHRAGRTARAGKRGAVTCLVTKRDVTLAAAIERAVARGEPLDTLSNDRRDYLPGGRLAAMTPLSKGDMKSAAGRQAAASSKGRPKANDQRGAFDQSRGPPAPPGSQPRRGGTSGGRGGASSGRGASGRGGGGRSGGSGRGSGRSSSAAR